MNEWKYKIIILNGTMKKIKKFINQLGITL